MKVFSKNNNIERKFQAGEQILCILKIECKPKSGPWILEILLQICQTNLKGTYMEELLMYSKVSKQVLDEKIWLESERQENIHSVKMHHLFDFNDFDGF